ncbi:unnamed protein product [Meloidogyne enterolobii]|uniref:Uncharacterized protein n=1 Tax=Meloidogyne enterolobii TaxID=390850 RepID=A0ACB0Y2Z0_MELEN
MFLPSVSPCNTNTNLNYYQHSPSTNNIRDNDNSLTTNNCLLKPGKFPVQKEDIVAASSFSSSFASMDTLRQKKRSRSQPGISLISTNSQQKLEKNLLQQDVDFIETDCCCLAETSQTNATLLWSASIEAKGERNSIITIYPQNKININGLSKSVVIIDRRKGGGDDRRNKDDEEEDNGNGGSCCSQDSGVRSSTHSTGSLTTASSNCGGCIIEEIDSGIANLNCNGSEDKQILNQKQQCFCSNIATTSKVLPPFLHLISCNSKENGCGSVGGVLFTAEAVFENVVNK